MDGKSEIPFDDETVEILLGKDQRERVCQIFVKNKNMKKIVSFSTGKYGEFQKKEKRLDWVFFLKKKKIFFFWFRLASDSNLNIENWYLRLFHFILCLDCGLSRVNRSSYSYLFPSSFRLLFNNLIAFIILCNGWLHLPNECFYKITIMIWC